MLLMFDIPVFTVSVTHALLWVKSTLYVAFSSVSVV